jgi:hypothetical protein
MEIPASSLMIINYLEFGKPATTYGTTSSLTRDSLLSYYVPTRNKFAIEVAAAGVVLVPPTAWEVHPAGRVETAVPSSYVFPVPAGAVSAAYCWGVVAYSFDVSAALVSASELAFPEAAAVPTITPLRTERRRTP